MSVVGVEYFKSLTLLTQAFTPLKLTLAGIILYSRTC